MCYWTRVSLLVSCSLSHMAHGGRDIPCCAADALPRWKWEALSSGGDEKNLPSGRVFGHL